tara:strand:- start:1 stop:909 length:909 start_codon:yes stop_codon:yes gene_type:complete
MKSFFGKCKSLVTGLFESICSISIGGGLFGLVLSTVISLILMLLAITGIVVCVITIVNLIGGMVLAVVGLIIMTLVLCFSFVYIIPVYLAFFLAKLSFLDGHFLGLSVVLCVIWTLILLVIIGKSYEKHKKKDDEDEDDEDDQPIKFRTETEQTPAPAPAEQKPVEPKPADDAEDNQELDDDEQESDAETILNALDNPNDVSDQIPSPSDESSDLDKVKHALAMIISQGPKISENFKLEDLKDYEAIPLTNLIRWHEEVQPCFNPVVYMLNVSKINITVPEICNSEQFYKALELAGLINNQD